MVSRPKPALASRGHCRGLQGAGCRGFLDARAIGNNGIISSSLPRITGQGTAPSHSQSRALRQTAPLVGEGEPTVTLGQLPGLIALTVRNVRLIRLAPSPR